MRYRVIVPVLIAFGVSVISCSRPKEVDGPETGDEGATAANRVAEQKAIPPDDEPLLLDDEPPLLAEVPVGNDSASVADNSRCHVCHINYQLEDITMAHAKAGMGCKDCHGDSDKHIADESWASGGPGTAPDRMFPRDTINPYCMTCHPKDSISLPQHTPVFAEGEDQKVCTDCHGEHRLQTRKCRWR